MNDKRRSPICFTVNQEASDFAKCTACSAKVERGKSVRVYSTNPLRKIPRTSDPLKYWEKQGLFLRASAKKYLAIPPSSVRNERVFSVSENINSERRNRLRPELSEKLVVIHDSLELILLEVEVVNDAFLTRKAFRIGMSLVVLGKCHMKGSIQDHMVVSSTIQRLIPRSIVFHRYCW